MLRQGLAPTYFGRMCIQVDIDEVECNLASPPNIYRELFAAVGKLSGLRVLRILAPFLEDVGTLTAVQSTNVAGLTAPSLPSLESLSNLEAPLLNTLEVAVRLEAYNWDSREHLVLPDAPLLKICIVQLVAADTFGAAYFGLRHSSSLARLETLSIHGVGSVSFVTLEGLGGLPSLRQLSLQGLRLLELGQVFTQLTSSRQLRSLDLDWNDALQLRGSDLLHLAQMKSLRRLSMRKREQPASSTSFGAQYTATNAWSPTSVRNIVTLLATVPQLWLIV